MRAEADKQTSLPYQWRHRAAITSLVGGYPHQSVRAISIIGHYGR